MRLVAASLVLAAFAAMPASAQHAGHGGMAPAEHERAVPEDPKEHHAKLIRKLEKLQEKIEVLDAELERTDLSPRKRARLEKKLKKLLAKKDALLDER